MDLKFRLILILSEWFVFMTICLLQDILHAQKILISPIFRVCISKKN